MRVAFAAVFSLIACIGLSQEPAKEKPRQSLIKSKEQKEKELSRKAPITSYRIITLSRDTTYVDTSLTIHDEYEFNYLRRDNFGLLPFSNEGQPYNILQYSLRQFSPYPEFGYKAKHINYLEANQIRYYSVATPLTELYYKTVVEQGHNLDAFITLNTSERLNFSIAYKGLRSIGKYINQLSSTGNFRFTTSYSTTTQRYVVNAHFVAQDMLNGENGGITTLENFESKDEDFKERQRLEVYFRDARSFMRGKRFFIDHSFRVNPSASVNNLYITHQLNYETKFFEYNHPTITSTVGAETVNRLGSAYIDSGINDQTKYNRIYNKIGAVYENSILGKFHFFAENFGYNYYYNTIYILADRIIPAELSDNINTAGAQYEYRKNKWNGNILYSNSITDQDLTTIEANVAYAFNAKNSLSFQYQKLNKLPDHLYNLHQSSFRAYNWYNDFKNEKINNIRIDATTQWANASLQISNFNDFLYFSNDTENDSIQLISPKQYGKAIKYLSLKANKEVKFWKLALDNTLLYQKVDQDEQILNVPDFVTRNTLYFSDYYFKRALYLQTGVILNYFTKYYANDYNPVVTEFFVQQKRQIGEFATLDFFINARIRQTRIFLKAEHFNSAWDKRNTFYSAPNYPYRDFLVRFGLVWNFFQ